MENGEASGSVLDGEEERRGTGNRRGHVRGHRRKRRGEFSSADPRRTGLKHVSAHASTEEGNSEGRGHQGPRPLDSLDPRSRGPVSTQAHPGTDLRSRFPTGVVWIPTETDSA